MNSKQFNIALTISLIVLLGILSSLFSSCSSSRKEEGNIRLSSENSKKDPSIILRAYNLNTNTIEALTIPDSIYNVYMKGDTVWAFNNVIRNISIVPKEGETINLNELVKIGMYTKYRIEE